MLGFGEIDLLVGVVIDPQRRLDGAAAIARGDLLAGTWFGRGGGEFRRQDHAGFIESDIALRLGGSLREFADDDQRSKRRQGTGAPCFGRAERIDKFRGKLKRQAFIAAEMMLVRAGIFIAGLADEDRAGDELEGSAVRSAAETSLAHIGKREIAMHFGERPVLGAERAAVVDDGNAAVRKKARSVHGEALSSPAAGNRTGLAHDAHARSRSRAACASAQSRLARKSRRSCRLTRARDGTAR